MSASDTPFADHPSVDPERDPSSNPFDRPTGVTGQGYARDREEEMGRQHPSGHPLSGDPTRVGVPSVEARGRDLPPESGRRAWIDPRTGEVHGSGMGSGGGNEGEDYNEETSGSS